MTGLVSGIFSLGIVSVVLTIEARLVSRELDQAIVNAMQDIKNGAAPRLGPNTRFFASGIEGFSAPAGIRELAPGFSEYLENGDAYYVLTKEQNGHRYQVVQDQDDFETRERVLYGVVAGGFVLSIALAWILGALIARRVISPVTELAAAVGNLRKNRDEATELATNYPCDEVGDLARTFDVTIKELHASLAREKLFTGDISHELRTPLMIISSSCELLDTYVNDPKSRVQVARIAEASKGIGHLVELLMLLAREKSNRASTVAQETLEQVALKVTSQRSSEIEMKGLALTLQTEGAPKCRFTEIALRTVLDNLLRNAIHYTDRGTLRLTLTATGFTIEDTGIGIPTAEHQKILEPFARGSQARGEGTGLGLSLVKRICVSQGWQLGISDLDSGGTRFSVDLLPSQPPSGNGHEYDLLIGESFSPRP